MSASTKKCEFSGCGKEFEPCRPESRFCSNSCVIKYGWEFRGRHVAVLSGNCKKCDGPILQDRPGRTKKFCSRECYKTFKEGRVQHTPGGYILVYRPEHPAAYASGQIFEHRVVMEGILGRYLEAHETVHHINGDRSDNRPENLQLRSGRHGKGVVHECADCGSRNVRTVEM